MELQRVAGLGLGDGDAVIGEGDRQKVELDVRPLHPGSRSHEAARFEMVGGPEACAIPEPLRADEALTDGVEMRPKGHGLGDFKLMVHLHMVHEIGTDARQRRDGGNAKAA